MLKGKMMHQVNQNFTQYTQKCKLKSTEYQMHENQEGKHVEGENDAKSTQNTQK